MPEPAMSLRQSRLGAASAAGRLQSEIIAVRWLRLAAGWFFRPRGGRAFDSLSGHMLRDIGIDPRGAERDSTVGFWRQQ